MGITLYGTIVLIHVIAAVVGLGASFAMPTVINHAKNAQQAKFSLYLNGKIEKFAKIGSITLLLTGLGLGALNPSLFTEIWYISSIVIYLAVQVIVAGIMPKKLKAMDALLQDHKGEDIPAEYNLINQGLKPYNFILHSSAIILIILMSIKPF
ncbi:hypothetical protein Q73_00990 [Bacillus coahuilensis m2-6]|uniref:Integral membrane protein n=1 Tax=Bacillus coahuilensis p1.1.43 TaxID=1150625 RepID=A0A147KC02_9BACI|nr:DUF2269 family protein [Bacillus coahuilensis]KUP09105.1 hypothetical protein Q75_01300 [Bacillus coahuilensis p1.1.43]KUP09844.1 hypothetical protein Q73_00990 [Bacillus coahuilensis m2-6]